MNELHKVNFLKANNWFEMNGQWHHPYLFKGMDLQSAYLYESFKHTSDGEATPEEHDV